MKGSYSEKEQQLFTSLGYEDLMDVVDIPPTLYNMAAMACFIENRTGKPVDSLRRCLRAIQGSYSEELIFRLTPEFDRLIDLD